MRLHRSVVLALLACTTFVASTQNARAQAITNKNRYAQKPAPAANRSVEELPMGGKSMKSSSAQSQSSPFEDDAPSHEQYYDGDSSYGGPGCNTCGDDYCCEPSGCGDVCGCGDACGGNSCCGQWFVTGDYLNVRAHFSEALSYVERVSTSSVNATRTEETYHQFNFDRESSFRVGGGWRNCCCGDEIRFNYTRLKSGAEDEAFTSGQGSGRVILVPYSEIAFQSADSLRMHADVEANVFDLDYRKTIPLGGCDSGCGDCCGPSCPAWDITWSGGIRGADVNWNRGYEVVDGVAGAVTSNTNTESDLDFTGAGPRFGVEGRRYFGKNGWFSIFLQGNVSLLLGELELQTTQFSSDVTADDRLVENLKVEEVIPVTDIEVGLSANLTCHSAFSAGYLFSAWHDLGFREEAIMPEPLLTQSYDDANMLSFDGFFARIEWSY